MNRLRPTSGLPKKVEKLIEIHSNLAGELANVNNSDPKGHCSAALIEALEAATKGTKLESEATELIATCKEILFEEECDED
ncbi:hypothetical protein ACTHQ2_24310 [Bacillus subtilis]|uniref:hypothetical protein n=1 Tax=Bacillus subtilis TaxID=1423 RepID=UPI003F7CC515